MSNLPNRPKIQTFLAPTGRPKGFDSKPRPIKSILEYVPNEKQAVFHRCAADVVLLGGAAGPGKSLAMLVEAFTVLRENPGSEGLLLRRSYPELERSLILESLKLFPRSICRYNEVKHRWIIRTKGADSILWFGFCKDESDVYDYQSSQFLFLGIDESTHFTWPMASYLFTRVRTAAAGSWCRIRLATNPGNVGHSWHKQYFGIGKDGREPMTVFTPEPTDDDPQPLSRCFIPARLTDNPILMQNDPNYFKRLSLLPPNLRAMLLDGSWEQQEGKYFTELTDKHFIAPFEIPAHWKIYRGVDYGFSAPFVCLWFAAAPDGHLYCFRELYARGLRDKEQAAAIRQASLEPVEYTMCDPSMGSRNASGTSPHENYMNSGVPMIPADHSRIAGWMAWRNALAPHVDGKPTLMIFETCKNLRRELGDAICDTKNPEDVNTTISDHAIDAGRYYLISRPIFAVEPRPDPYARLDEASRREWIRQDKKAAKSANQSKAILDGFNRENDGEEDAPF